MPPRSPLRGPGILLALTLVRVTAILVVLAVLKATGVI